MTNKPTNKLLYDVIRDRGTAYLMVFRELKARYGEDEAKDVMRSASRAHGLYVGKSLARCALRDFECMAKGFAKSPDDGSVFCPDIRRLDSTCLEVKLWRAKDGKGENVAMILSMIGRECRLWFLIITV